MVNYTILDLAYKQMLSTSGKSFTKETLADLPDEIFVGEDSTLPVYDEESAKILDSLIGSLKDEEAETLLREKLESKKAVITDCKRVFVERENKALKAKVQELEDSVKASEELQTKIKSLEDSSIQLNTEVEALKTKLADKEKDLLNSIKIIEDMKKEVTEENNETNSDSSVDKKEIDHKNEIMDKAGTVESPSTTHTEVAINKSETEDSDLTDRENNIIKKFKSLMKDGKTNEAQFYLANNKQYIRRSFDFKKLKGDN
jgi:DNA repair exonuclease SbcCD ATPase subunit